MTTRVSIQEQLALLFHPSTVQALLDLSDPFKSVSLPVATGKAPGRLDIVYQLYPPAGVHRNSFPATFTVGIGSRYHDLKVMVSMVDTCDGGDGLIFGYLAFDYWQRISKKSGLQVDSQQHYVAIGYNPVTRDGDVRVYKEVYAALYTLVQNYGIGSGVTINAEDD